MMKFYKTLCFTLIALMALSSCSKNKSSIKKGTWSLTAYNYEAFSPTTIGASDGYSNYVGMLESDNFEIEFLKDSYIMTGEYILEQETSASVIFGEEEDTITTTIVSKVTVEDNILTGNWDVEGDILSGVVFQPSIVLFGGNDYVLSTDYIIAELDKNTLQLTFDSVQDNDRVSGTLIFEKKD